jgi:hypothetical protein
MAEMDFGLDGVCKGFNSRNVYTLPRGFQRFLNMKNVAALVFQALTRITRQSKNRAF